MDEGRRRVIGIGAVVAGTLAARGGAAQPAAGEATPAPADSAATGHTLPAADAPALRLLSFAGPGGAPRLGAIGASGRVVDLSAVWAGGGPADMVALIAGGPAALAQARHLAAAPGADAPLPGALRLLAPIAPLTRNVYAVGWNYLEHFEEGNSRYGKRDLPAHPVFFTKGVHTLNGPFDPIPYDPAVSTQIDWEGELAVVVGQGGRNIAEADALGHVFGYTVINDTTARDVQHDHGGQWFKGKSLDGHGPMGPWIVPAADLDFDNLDLETRVNGVVKQSVNTRLMYFKVPRILAELSRGMTLEPGDIIATGTPSGIGVARTPPEFLKPGDVMETTIAQIGTLRNVIGA